MYNLLQLFLRLSGLIVFVLLEVLCFSLIVKYNQKQQDIFANSTNLFSAFMKEKSADANEYLKLRKENERLAKNNAVLLEQLAELGIDTSDYHYNVETDSLVPNYSVLEAKVLKNSINLHHNYLLLNKGSKDGVVPNSGVMTENGVVGIVRKVSNSRSVVMSILHRQSKTSARIKGKYQFGSLVWNSPDSRYFNLEEVPKFAPIVKGDTVETSGYSSIFPPGIMLGTIEKLWIEAGSNFYTIEVRSTLNLSNIQYVYIIKNFFKDEQDQLIQEAIKEDE